jgi:alpha-1,6-mannosyltransferase
MLGLSMSVKTTIGVVLPFAALLAAGGLAAGWPALIRRGGAVVAGTLGTLFGLSAVTGLGFGWVGALSNPGESESWTSPPTAVGLAVEAVGRWFGQTWNAVPIARDVALVALAVALVAICWHSRNRNQIYGAGLACLALIFMAPITQPWYLTWPLALFAATLVRARWFAALIVFSMFTILPDGDGSLKPLQVPLSFAMSGVVVWALWRGIGWLRAPLAAAEPARLETVDA